MTLNIPCYLMDRGAGLISPVPRTIQVPHGESVALVGKVHRDDLTFPNLSGATITFRLVTYASGAKLYETTSTNGSRDGDFTLTVALPTSIQPGTYAWDLWLSLDGALRSIHPLSAWKSLLSTR